MNLKKESWLAGTEEPNKVKRAWRYVKGSLTNILIGTIRIRWRVRETILYWQRDAATAWPGRMDYSPDFESSLSKQLMRKALVDAFGKIQNPPATTLDRKVAVKRIAVSFSAQSGYLCAD